MKSMKPSENVEITVTETVGKGLNPSWTIATVPFTIILKPCSAAQAAGAMEAVVNRVIDMIGKEMAESGVQFFETAGMSRDEVSDFGFHVLFTRSNDPYEKIPVEIRHV